MGKVEISGSWDDFFQKIVLPPTIGHERVQTLGET